MYLLTYILEYFQPWDASAHPALSLSRSPPLSLQSRSNKRVLLPPAVKQRVPHDFRPNHTHLRERSLSLPLSISLSLSRLSRLSLSLSLARARARSLFFFLRSRVRTLSPKAQIVPWQIRPRGLLSRASARAASPRTSSSQPATTQIDVSELPSPSTFEVYS